MEPANVIKALEEQIFCQFEILIESRDLINMSCHTNCAVLNITSCAFTLARQVRVKQVKYDRHGCFSESDYLRDGDKYSTFIEVRGQYK